MFKTKLILISSMCISLIVGFTIFFTYNPKDDKSSDGDTGKNNSKSKGLKSKTNKEKPCALHKEDIDKSGTDEKKDTSKEIKNNEKSNENQDYTSKVPDSDTFNDKKAKITNLNLLETKEKTLEDFNTKKQVTNSDGELSQTNVAAKKDLDENDSIPNKPFSSSNFQSSDHQNINLNERATPKPQLDNNSHKKQFNFEYGQNHKDGFKSGNGHHGHSHINGKSNFGQGHHGNCSHGNCSHGNCSHGNCSHGHCSHGHCSHGHRSHGNCFYGHCRLNNQYHNGANVVTPLHGPQKPQFQSNCNELPDDTTMKILMTQKNQIQMAWDTMKARNSGIDDLTLKKFFISAVMLSYIDRSFLLSTIVIGIRGRYEYLSPSFFNEKLIEKVVPDNQGNISKFLFGYQDGATDNILDLPFTIKDDKMIFLVDETQKTLMRNNTDFVNAVLKNPRSVCEQEKINLISDKTIWIDDFYQVSPIEYICGKVITEVLTNKEI